MSQKKSKKFKGRTHLFISDTQVKPKVKTDHLTWLGQYIVDKKPDVIVHIGDHWDMESLSSYDRGTKGFEGRRYKLDIKAGNDAMDLLLKPLRDYNKNQARNKKKQYKPEMHFCIGNHEQRIDRAIQARAELDGTIGYQDLNLKGWTVHEFLKPVVIDGVSYAHYFYNPMSGRPYGGTCHTKLKNIGFSFSMGHQQGLDIATRGLANGNMVRGLVSGSYYQHDENYKGHQGNNHWRGVILKTEVQDGNYNLIEVSLDYLKRRYK